MSIKYSFLLFVLVSTSLITAWPFTRASSTLIMLEAAGHSKNMGRVIEDSFEQGLTLSYAYRLKQLLKQQLPDIEVLVNRTATDALESLQTTNFANQLPLQLYISINFYHDTGTKPHLHLYQFCGGNTMQTISPTACAFYSYDLAFLFNRQKSDAIAQQIKKTVMAQEYASLFEYGGLYKLPFKPLIGITAPAIAFEAGLRHPDDWQLYLQPMVEAIIAVVQQGILT